MKSANLLGLTVLVLESCKFRNGSLQSMSTIRMMKADFLCMLTRQIEDVLATLVRTPCLP